MLGALLVALAGPGYVNSEVPDPLGPMTLSNLTAATGDAGTGPVGPPTGPLETSASVRLKWRALNRDDDAYRIDVYLDGAGYFASINKLGTDPFNFNITGYAPVVWEQGWDDLISGFGEFFNVGYVENGPVATQTVDWSFRVELVRLADGAVVQTLRTPWKKTYGTCS